MSNKKYKHDSLPITLAMCAPAVRMVVVAALGFRDETTGVMKFDHWVYPVLAIVAQQDTMNDQFIDFDVVIYDEEYGLSDARFAFQDSNCCYQIVMAPWPESEDSSRLTPTINELREQVFLKASENQKDKSS